MGKFCEFCGNPTPNGTCTCQEYINKYGNISTSQQKKVSLNKNDNSNDIEYQPIISDEPSNTDLAVKQSQQIQPKIQVPVYTQPYMKIPTYYQANPQAYLQQQSNPIQNNNYIQSVANVVQQAKINIQETDLGKIMDKVDTEKLQESIDNIPIKNEFIKKNLLSICCILSLVFLFLPFIKFSSTSDIISNDMTFNGISCLFGEYNSILSVIMFLMPIIILLRNHIGFIKPYKKTLVTVGPIISLIFEIITFLVIKSIYISYVDSMDLISDYVKVSVNAQIGFFLLILSYILTFVAGLIVNKGSD